MINCHAFVQPPFNTDLSGGRADMVGYHIDPFKRFAILKKLCRYNMLVGFHALENTQGIFTRSHNLINSPFLIVNPSESK